MILSFLILCTTVLIVRSHNLRSFPEGFKFGVATAAYQIEGGWNKDDKGESIWDYRAHTNASLIKNGDNADVACDSYHNWRRDVKMLKMLGVDHYRFSISWPRILPGGFSNNVSKAGVKYYSDLIDALIADDIEPVVTIYHWDLPQKLQELGGWANSLIVNWMEDYARVLFEKFGDRVKRWITINEPKQICLYGYGLTRLAPGLGFGGIAEYICTKNVLLAHARVWRMYDKEYRSAQKGKIGLVIAADWRMNATDSADDIEAGLDANAFENDLYMDPIFLGGWPKRVESRIAKKSADQGYPRSRLPELSSEEIAYINGTYDFYGMNHYSTRFYYRNSSMPKYTVPSYDDDMSAVSTWLNWTEAGASSFLHVIPFGIRASLNHVRVRYGNPPVFIAENGYSSEDSDLDDDHRISYLQRYLNSVLDAIDDGCNVIAYTVWSLMDNLSWADGFSTKYGLFKVDFTLENRTRTARKSAYFFQNLVSTRALNITYDYDLNDVETY